MRINFEVRYKFEWQWWTVVRVGRGQFAVLAPPGETCESKAQFLIDFKKELKKLHY